MLNRKIMGDVEDIRDADYSFAATELANAAKAFYQRGWVLGTSGNFSRVLSRTPLRLAITASGLHKGELTATDFLVIDEAGVVLFGLGKPSAETQLHIAIARATDARAILHTHSVWATILSETDAEEGGLTIEGYEMLKGLAGVTTHEHREWIPILENTQNYAALAHEMTELLAKKPDIHAILLARHGLYTWGSDVGEAQRHVEILEFLFEVKGRLQLSQAG
jgi:methylthioribulose-1-phosphate dehydratase